MIGVKRKKKQEAEQDATKQNAPVCYWLYQSSCSKNFANCRMRFAFV